MMINSFRHRSGEQAIYWNTTSFTSSIPLIEPIKFSKRSNTTNNINVPGLLSVPRKVKFGSKNFLSIFASTPTFKSRLCVPTITCTHRPKTLPTVLSELLTVDIQCRVSNCLLPQALPPSTRPGRASCASRSLHLFSTFFIHYHRMPLALQHRLFSKAFLFTLRLKTLKFLREGLWRHVKALSM